MSGDDGFLARWSRRKRSSAARKRDSARPQPPTVATVDIAPPVARDASATIAEPPPLPPIESLDSASDITPFLAPGVPAELTRRALRRAWQTDPAIRDFVGLSENAWDFNAPGGVPGFGALTAEEVDRLLARALGPADSADAAPLPGEEAAPPADAAPASGAEAGSSSEDRDFASDHLKRSRKIAGDAALRQEIGEAEADRPRPPRNHGGALPK